MPPLKRNYTKPGWDNRSEERKLNSDNGMGTASAMTTSTASRHAVILENQNLAAKFADIGRPRADGPSKK